ncbi:TIR domain-containing protein [Primorskyibacter flagellatus]|uniref:TIR domain-containing protein n=1 Tax=Primorskyibacter flagellatus TaxID=1387277 RepID=A0A1W2EXE2_9RHOB|nr:TIR domain-containing protein [Primorskyibacter flagellatus]
MRAFISYSHRDSSALERLHVHLAALRREGRIEAWFDREILAGSVLDDEIRSELEVADLFLLLVSPDFIASDYCVEQEMRRALERHDAGDARVVPIIVEPCDWASMNALRRLKAVPVDGKPVSEWTNANTAYLNVVQELRRIIDAKHIPDVALSEPKVRASTRDKSPRYRVKRDFDEIDRSDFRETAFTTIKTYFENAAQEIDTLEGLRSRFVDRGRTAFGCTIVNQERKGGTAHITVHCRGSSYALGDIYYSFSENAPDNTANGALNIAADDYEQYLTATMSMFGREHDRLNSDQAAVYLWNQFIDQAGISPG